MKVVKKTDEYTIFEKRNGRLAVKTADRKWVNGDDKVKILVDEKLLKVTLPQPKAEEPEEAEAAADEAGEEAAAEE